MNNDYSAEALAAEIAHDRLARRSEHFHLLVKGDSELAIQLDRLTTNGRRVY